MLCAASPTASRVPSPPREPHCQGKVTGTRTPHPPAASAGNAARAPGGRCLETPAASSRAEPRWAEKPRAAAMERGFQLGCGLSGV